MKSFRTLLVVFLLILQINGYLVQLHEASSRRKAMIVASRRFYRVLAMETEFEKLKAAIKNIFNKQDFKFTIGLELNLSIKDLFGNEAAGEVKATGKDKKGNNLVVNLELPLVIPLSISLFHESNTEETKNGCNKILKFDWCYKFKPSKEDLKTLFDPVSNMTYEQFKAKVSDKLSELVKVIVTTLLLSIFGYTAKNVIALIFPPITIPLYIYELIEELKNIKFEQVKGNTDLYEIGYSYPLDLKQYVPNALEFKAFITIVVNLGQLKAILNSWKEKAATYIKENFKKFKENVSLSLTKAEDLLNQAQESISTACSVIDIYLSNNKNFKAAKELILSNVNKAFTKINSLVTRIEQSAENFKNYVKENMIEPIKNLGANLKNLFTKKFIKSTPGGRLILNRLAKNQISFKTAIRRLNRRLVFF